MSEKPPRITLPDDEKRQSRLSKVRESLDAKRKAEENKTELETWNEQRATQGVKIGEAESSPELVVHEKKSARIKSARIAERLHAPIPEQLLTQETEISDPLVRAAFELIPNTLPVIAGPLHDHSDVYVGSMNRRSATETAEVVKNRAAAKKKAYIEDLATPAPEPIDAEFEELTPLPNNTLQAPIHVQEEGRSDKGHGEEQAQMAEEVMRDSEKNSKTIELPDLTKKKPKTPKSKKPTSAEELKRIRGLSREDRVSAISEFKSKLDAQQHAWSDYRVAVEKKLEEDPETSKKESLALLKNYPAINAFSNENKVTAETILDRYVEQRQKMLKLRARFPNDVDLVNHLTGEILPPETKLRVEIRAMSIEVYAAAENIDTLIKNKLPLDRGHESTTGVAGVSEDGVYFSLVKEGSGEKDTAIHEMQHNINRLFEEEFARGHGRINPEDPWESISSSSDEQKRQKLRDSFTEMKRMALDLVRDETFACIVESNPPTPDQLRRMFEPGKDYDYLRQVRDLHVDEPIWKEVSDQVLVHDYKKNIHSGLSALELMRQSYSPQEIIALLSSVPMEHWSKTVARIYQEKLSDPTIKAAEMLAVKERLEKLKEGKEGEEDKKTDEEKADEVEDVEKPANDNKHPKDKTFGQMTWPERGVAAGKLGAAVALTGIPVASLGVGAWAIGAAWGTPVAGLGGIGVMLGGFALIARFGVMEGLMMSALKAFFFDGGLQSYAGDLAKSLGWSGLSFGKGGGDHKPAKAAKKAKTKGGGGDHGHAVNDNHKPAANDNHGHGDSHAPAAAAHH